MVIGGSQKMLLRQKRWALWLFILIHSGFSFALGALFLFLFAKAAKRASIDAPSGFQNFVESIIDFIDENVRGSFRGKNPMVAPLALTTFVWIFLMNVMDLVPVDWLPVLAQKIGGLFGADPHHVYPKSSPAH